MRAVINGKIVTENNILENGVVIFDEYIEKVGKDINTDGCEIIDACGNYVLPGFVDVHIHGYKGIDVSDAEEEKIINMAKLLPENGVTAWCPTTMTVAKDTIQKTLDIIKKLKKENVGAKILGANVEGPFINPKKKGAQSEEFILPPDSKFIIDNKDSIKLVTLAPETENAFEFIKNVSQNTAIAVSVGHTDADFETAKKAFEYGANHVTHLFNAMPPLNHRNPGVVGAAFENGNVFCEMIADKFHIHPTLFKTVFKIKGEKLILITDCMRAGGMPDGEYTLGGQKVTVKGVECRLKDGTIAGSILTLNKALYNFMTETGLPVWEAVKAVSLSPAKSIGEDKKRGSLSVGKYADIVIADEKINIKNTFVGGQKVF